MVSGLVFDLTLLWTHVHVPSRQHACSVRVSCPTLAAVPRVLLSAPASPQFSLGFLMYLLLIKALQSKHLRYDRHSHHQTFVSLNQSRLRKIFSNTGKTFHRWLQVNNVFRFSSLSGNFLSSRLPVFGSPPRAGTRSSDDRIKVQLV